MSAELNLLALFFFFFFYWVLMTLVCQAGPLRLLMPRSPSPPFGQVGDLVFIGVVK